MDLKPIRVFLTVADRQSFVGAAEELGLAPASVTRIIASLERELGAQLFVRTTRQVRITSEGAMIAARYRPVIESFDSVTDELLQQNQPERGTLRINAPVSLGVQLLPEAIAGFRLAYPNIDLQLSFTDRLVDVIAENCDLAIRVSGPPSDKSTIWRKLCEVPRRAVASPSLMARMDAPGHPGDLDPRLCLSYSANGARETWNFTHRTGQRTIRAGSGIISNSGDFLCAMAVAGEGIAALPDFITEPGLNAGTLVELCPDWSLPSLWLTLFYPPYPRLPPLVGLFSDYFATYVTAPPRA